MVRINFINSASRVENKLFILNNRLIKEKVALLSLQEQADTLCEIAEESRIRALVADTLFDKEQAEQAQRHANLALQSLDKEKGIISKLEREREKLLNQLI